LQEVSFVNLILCSLLLGGLLLGHLALMLRVHNWLYGQHIPRHFSKVLHLTFGSLILALPLMLARTNTWDLLAWSTSHASNPAAWSAIVYGALCCTIAYFILPWITLSRWLRPHPPCVVSTTSRVVDMTRELGYLPVGREALSLAAYLPMNQIFQVDFAEKTIEVPRLPRAWAGLKVLHLTDLHMCGTPDRRYYQEVMELCSAWEPDVVAVTGDFVDSIHHHGWIIPTLGWLRWKVAAFAILGNHDAWYDPDGVRHQLEQLGVQVLANRWDLIDVRGEPMLVIGNESPWFQPAPDLGGCPAEPFRFCLTHTPDNLPWARRNKVDLMLAGHVHGGQVRLPVIGPLLVPSRYGRRYASGTFHEPPTILHVGRGLGSEQPLRIGCPPEVALLTLQPAGSSNRPEMEG
jgi:predicted MPP superfamily phosphohydrolase